LARTGGRYAAAMSPTAKEYKMRTSYKSFRAGLAGMLTLALAPALAWAGPAPQRSVAGNGILTQAQFVEVEPGSVVIEDYDRPVAVYEDDDDDDAPNVTIVMPAAPVARCTAQFRSFDPQSGLYRTFAGELRPCPYL
jgi:hypothetical protein